MLRTVIAATAALGLAAGCAPDTKAPVKVRALVRSSNGQYVPQEVELTTVTDIVSLNGSVADFKGGARIVLDPNDPALQTATEETLEAVLVKESGHDVVASYIDQDGVLWPSDFHTWNMVTAYYNLERASDYFHTVGNVKDATFAPIPTLHYFPDFVQTEISKDPLRDNAIFYSPLQSFLVLPFEEIQRAPLAINAGIMAHEYSHLVFNRLTYVGRSIPDVMTLWSIQSPSPGANVLKALDEGLADYHAYGTTCASPSGCDPRFMGPSFDGPFQKVVEDRDLSRADRCLDATLRDQMLAQSVAQWTGNGSEYKLGTMLATALYQAGRSVNQEQVLRRAIVSAYYDENAQTPGLYQLTKKFEDNQSQFTLAVAVGAIITHIGDTELRKAVCNELIDHLQIPAELLMNGGINACPASTSGGTTCPNING